MKFEIKKGKIKSAIRLVAYGSEGIGKSTFASQFPDPLFIDVEGGTKQLDIARFPQPDTWSELLAMVDAVIAEPTICQTLVIDTIDRAETLLSAQLLAESGVDSIEKYGGGYGKGYTAIQERFNKDLEAARAKAGAPIIITRPVIEVPKVDIEAIQRQYPDAIPVQAPVKGQMLWGIDVDDASSAPVVGTAVSADEPMGFIQTYYGMEEILPLTDGRIAATLAKQGENVAKGEIVAFIQK